MDLTPQEAEASREQAKNFVDITEVIAGIQMKRSLALERKINVYPRTHFIASDITDCDKYATHSILDWEQKERFTPDTIARFEVGNKEELNLISELSALGIQIIHSQAPFEIPHPKTGEMICRGKIDGKIHVDRHNQFPIEFKSIAPNLFDQIDTYEDLDRLPHLRKYKRQMQLYLYGNNKEVGVMLFSNLLGRWKFIVVYRDDAEVDFILKRLQSNWDLVKEKKHGTPILYDEKICGKCSFRHICLPDIKRDGAEMLEDSTLEKMIAEVTELKPLAKKYEALDERVKDIFKARTDNSKVFFVGADWRVDVVVREGHRLDQKAIPQDIKDQYQKDTITTTVSFSDITRGLGVQTQAQKNDAESAGAKDAPAPQGSAPAPAHARTQGSPAKKKVASSAVADKLAKMKKEVAKESKVKTKKKKGA